MPIDKIYRLFGEGKLDEAYDLSTKDQEFETKVLNCIILEKKGKFKEALESINNLLNHDSCNSLFFKFMALITKTSILLDLGEVKQSEIIISKIENIITDIERENLRFEKWRANYLSIKGQTYLKLGEIDEAISNLSNALFIRQQLDIKYDIATSLLRLGEAYLIKGELDFALGYHRLCLPIYRELGNQVKIAKTLVNTGEILLYKGNYELALQTFNSCIDLYEKSGNKYYIGYCNRLIGSIFQQKGELNQALAKFQSSLKIFHGLSNRPEMGRSLNNIGEIYFIKGDLTLAQHYFSKSMEIKEETGNLIELSYTIRNFANTLRFNKQFKQSIDYYIRSLEIYQQIGHQNQEAYSLFDLIVTLIEAREFIHVVDIIENYLDQLSLLAQKSNNPIIELFNEISQAYYFSQEDDKKSQQRAINQFREILLSSVITYELSIFVMLNLCELLLNEIQKYDNDEILSELVELLEKLDNLAISNDSISLSAQIKLLRAKFSILSLDLDEIKKQFSEIDDLLDTQDLPNIRNKIIHEKEKYDRMLTLISNRNGQLMDKSFDINDLKTDLKLSINQLLKTPQFIAGTHYKKRKLDLKQLRLFSNPDKFPAAIFKVTEMGPVVELKDFTSFPEKLAVNEQSFLYQLAINFSVVIGQGHSYHEGIFDLPASKNYRALVYSFRVPDPKAIDKRMLLGYLQLCIFIPKKIHQLLPSGSAIESKIQNITQDISSVEAINLDIMREMKTKILQAIKNLIETE